MKAIILAAGRGSRMKSLTEGSPKCLVELCGKPLLEWQLEALYGAGVDSIGIVTGFNRKMLLGRGLREFYNARWAETNMVSSLACAAEWLSAGPCIVSYSDIFYDAEVVVALMKCDAPLAVAFDPNWLALWKKRFGNPLLDAETFRFNPDGTLLEIGSKPRSVAEIEGQYMGLLRFTPEGWREIERIRHSLPAERSDGIHMTAILQQVIEADRVRVAAVPNGNEWGEIDSIEDLAVYRGFSGFGNEHRPRRDSTS